MSVEQLGGQEAFSALPGQLTPTISDVQEQAASQPAIAIGQPTQQPIPVQQHRGQ